MHPPHHALLCPHLLCPPPSTHVKARCMIGEAQKVALCTATNTEDNGQTFPTRVRQASPLRVAACSDKELKKFFTKVCAAKPESSIFIEQTETETETTETPSSSLRQGHAIREAIAHTKTHYIESMNDIQQANRDGVAEINRRVGNPHKADNNAAAAAAGRSSKRGNKRRSSTSPSSLLEVLSAQRGLMEEERQHKAQAKTRVQVEMESSRAYAEANAEQQIYMRRLAGGAERITSREEHVRVFHKDKTLAEANAQGLGLDAAKLQVLKGLGIPTNLRVQAGIVGNRQFFTPIFSFMDIVRFCTVLHPPHPDPTCCFRNLNPVPWCLAAMFCPTHAVSALVIELLRMRGPGIPPVLSPERVCSLAFLPRSPPSLTPSAPLRSSDDPCTRLHLALRSQGTQDYGWCYKAFDLVMLMSSGGIMAAVDMLEK